MKQTTKDDIIAELEKVIQIQDKLLENRAIQIRLLNERYEDLSKLKTLKQVV